MSYELTSSPEELKERFFSLRSPQGVARILDVKYKDLIYWIYRRPVSVRYTRFEIAKKFGSPRTIEAPDTNIKILQRKLNQVLLAVYKPKQCVHGFAPGRSVRTNALRHVGRKYVFNIDLKDFFPSINFGRVRGMFMGKPYNLPPGVATLLAHLCCFEGRLPQGAPTSPVISNMICAKMDSQLQRLAAANRSTYTRYADDMTFSTARRTMPTTIAVANDLGQIQPGVELQTIITENGFTIHPEKIWLRGQDRRQEVTGVIVNEFPNLPRKFINQVRAMLHAWERYELPAAQSEFAARHDHKHRRPGTSAPRFEVVLKGKIEYLGMIKGTSSSTYLRFLDKLGRLEPRLASGRGSGLELLFRRYEALCKSTDPQGRGFLLQDLLRDTFAHFSISVEKSFTRNAGGEQIDGAFILNTRHFIAECRWREAVADIRQVDGLLGQVLRSGNQTMGVFFSINGWSGNVPVLLKQNPDKVIILTNGEDFRCVLNGEIGLEKLLEEKIKELHFRSEPFLSGNEITSRERG